MIRNIYLNGTIRKDARATPLRWCVELFSYGDIRATPLLEKISGLRPYAGVLNYFSTKMSGLRPFKHDI
jgi:hypothetical protein